jgi:predicted nucleotidyltransferase
MHHISEKIDRAVQKIKSLGCDKVRFITLYGSASVGSMNEDSDIDISVYYDDADASEFRLEVLTELFDDVYDIKIFQQLPLPLRMQVLKGKVLYSDDTPLCTTKPMKLLYKEFESFKRRYYDYLGIESLA